MENNSQIRSLPPLSSFPFPHQCREQVFLVTAGRLSATFFTNSQRRPIVVNLTPGDFFGMISGNDPKSISCELEIAERSTVMMIPREALLNALELQREARNHRATLAGWGMVHFYQRLADNFFVSTQQRLAKFLHDHVAEKYVPMGVAIIGLTDNLLASLIDSSPEIVRACLDDFERAQIIHQIGRRLEVLDLEGLANWEQLELREPLRTGGTVRVVR